MGGEMGGSRVCIIWVVVGRRPRGGVECGKDIYTAVGA
jgi:hypothetical protein